MPKVSKESAKHEDYGPVESWHEEVDGRAIEFVQFKQDIDSTPMLKGCPTTSAIARTGGTCSREG
jgi:hypothetical protein